MKYLGNNSNFPQNVALILGFFDGIHAGHQNVIRNCPDVTKVLVTFSSSPACYFGHQADNIYSRKYNYILCEQFGVEYVYEQDFQKIAKMSAADYLRKLIEIFAPTSITTGFNHTFGADREGNSYFLENNQGKYTYYCTPATTIDNQIVSSTQIKTLLKKADITQANKMLTRNFSISSTVIEGKKIGRQLGFPTANMIYPKDIVRIPYGVYKVLANGRPAVMNWGIKPTIGAEETLEVHIPNYNADLYGKNLTIEIISKIREEIKFHNLEELKSQIKKDIETCLK